MIQPDWLNYRRNVWINFCEQCKRLIRNKRLVEDDVPNYLCGECCFVLIKYGSKHWEDRSNLKKKCSKCGEYYVQVCKRCFGGIRR